MQPLDLQRLIQIIVEEIAASESAPLSENRFKNRCTHPEYALSVTRE